MAKKRMTLAETLTVVVFSLLFLSPLIVIIIRRIWL